VLVRFTRTLKLGSIGKDVKAVKRALSRAGYIRWGGFTPFLGPFAVRSLKRFQKAKRLKADGVYGLATHNVLCKCKAKRKPKEMAFDKYARSLMASWEDPNAEDTIRKEMVRVAMYAVAREPYIHYSQARPMVDMAPPPNYPSVMDCSGFATWVYKSVGAPDPNGYSPEYPGWGYTGTQIAHGRKVEPKDLKPGDLVFYGRGSVTHVAIYIGDGKVASHGSEGGPMVLPMYYRSDFHHARTYPVR
jgi:cell wall-associated NlpC family hydrolase